ncbi:MULTISPECIES: class III lanthipeptide [unclassified Stenotrophomonas]|nr:MULTISPECIES: class III lanthipeptide [unclassified Stenotrophomonas]
MNRVLNLQRLALDTSVSVMGNSSTSSTHTCCGPEQVEKLS